MDSTKSTNKLNSENIRNKLRNIKRIKWLLNLEYSKQEFIYEDLQIQLHNFCYQNVLQLIVINHFLSQITEKIRFSINKIIQAKDNYKLCRNFYFEYLRNFYNNIDFKEFEIYMFTHRGHSAKSEIKDFEKLKFVEQINTLEKRVLEHKRGQLALIFYIIQNNDTPNLFVKKDFKENLPQLLYWIKENINKPIKNLTNDECKILAGCLLGLTYDEMLETLKLSSFVKNYEDINNIIKALPAKFGVLNLYQVLFRIHLLKPSLWSNYATEDIVKSIKDMALLQF